MDCNLLVLLGPTACGKTRLAAAVAQRISGEIISADSRQVYRQMNIGTGKDLDEYTIEGSKVAVHLLDILDPAEEYNVFHFQKDFQRVFHDISSRGKFPLLCGGTGLYIESVLGDYRFSSVPRNETLRQWMKEQPREHLIGLLHSLHPLHSTTDTGDTERLFRAIEIATYQKENPPAASLLQQIIPLTFGINPGRQAVRERITHRLLQRLENGMIDEVRQLLDRGVAEERLLAFGLEYKYLTLYLSGKLSYSETVGLLNTAIHQFAKRQMTWFRRMEKNGFPIEWIDGNLQEEEKIQKILYRLGHQTK